MGTALVLVNIFAKRPPRVRLIRSTLIGAAPFSPAWNRIPTGRRGFQSNTNHENSRLRQFRFRQEHARAAVGGPGTTHGRCSTTAADAPAWHWCRPGAGEDGQAAQAVLEEAHTILCERTEFLWFPSP